MRTHLRVIAVLLPLVATSLPVPALAQWYYPAESDLRITVKPKEASVYVDGYFAGKVDDFDGALQRLHVTPGHPRCALPRGLPVAEEVALPQPNATRTIPGALEKLSPGEAPEPEPRPTEPERMETPPEDTYRQPHLLHNDGRVRRGPPASRRLNLPRAPRPRVHRSSRRCRCASSRTASSSASTGSGGGAVRRRAPHRPGAKGHHVIEAERDGYEQFTTDVDVHAGETVPISITLRKR